MDQIRTIPLSALRESPFNPRKTFPEAELAELAESIKSQGVMQPVVVRLVGDPATHDYSTPLYELVFGHRRTRAAALAGLSEVPAIVRDLSDEETAIAQVHENTKRTDVTAIEEADSFAHLSKAHRMSADAIAEAVGKSRSYVYGRLKLASAAPEVRLAITEQGLSPETGLELARVSSHNLQRTALKSLRLPYAESAEKPIVWMSVRDARIRLDSMFKVRLAVATFDQADATLTNAGACSACPKLAANNPDLSELSADTCTDKACFEAKGEAHKARLASDCRDRISAWRAKGGKVIDVDDARIIWPANHVGMIRGYTPVDDSVDDELAEHGTFATVLPSMENAPSTVLIANPHDATHAVECIADVDIEAVLKHLGIDIDEQDGAAGFSFKDRAGGEAEIASWTPSECMTTDMRAWLDVRKAVAAAVPSHPRTAECMRMVLKHELHCAGDFGLAGDVLGWRIRFEEAAESNPTLDANGIYNALIDAASPDDIAALMVAIAIDTLLGTHTPRTKGCHALATKRVALAERYGVVIAGAPATQADPLPEEADGAIDGDDEEDDDDQDEAPRDRPKAGKTKPQARYRNASTGETWSGRGLQPRWLKAALADGLAKLSDFEVSNKEGATA